MVNPNIIQTARAMSQDMVEFQLKRQGKSKITLQGKSMLPTYTGGEQFDLVAPSKENLRAGNLILFRTGGEIHLHRLVAHSGSGLQQQGDAQGRSTRISRSQVVGVASQVTLADGKEVDLLSPGSRIKARKKARILRFRGRLNKILGFLQRYLGFPRGTGLLAKKSHKKKDQPE